VNVLPGAKGLDKCHELAFVIRRSASANDSPCVCLLHGGVERVAVPQIERIDRLHIVVAVKQKVGGAVLWPCMGHDHRMARCRAFFCRNAKALQVSHQPVSGILTILLERRIGRD
jgi:hypothetical protein